MQSSGIFAIEGVERHAPFPRVVNRERLITRIGYDESVLVRDGTDVEVLEELRHVTLAHHLSGAVLTLDVVAWRFAEEEASSMPPRQDEVADVKGDV